MIKYAYLIGGVILLIGGAFAIYLIQMRKNSGTHQRSWIDYLLLWPLILDANKTERGGKFLTTREWFGWATIALIIICAIIFT